MKQWFNDQQSPDVSHNASKSDQSYYNQEIGSNPTSGNKDSLTKDCSFRLPMDLTCARRVIAEALGTFILVFCICGIVASMHLTGGQVGLLEYAIAAALTVIVVVFSIGGISGAHVNPAVTIAFATVGPFPWSKVPLYILAQLGGSMLATYAGKLIYGVESELMITRPLQGSTAAFWVELIATFILLLLAASLSDETQIVGKLSGFMVGVAIGLGVLITGYTSKMFTCISAFNIVQSVRIAKRPVSGGSMNPARSLGPAIVSWKFQDVWIYLTAPTIGAVSGALVYRALRLQGWNCTSTSPPATAAHCHASH
ncbi:hypothetical protein RJ640_028900 [Escallonia rubra]|uniref:Aquaporin NIP7-1 n=1 Tax=Escallonia rubra TaxID=112253 RepID=A0AA88QPX9_9ASTE|nr:hypothetical protein RJ640_028900 [Escallonia rubra]